MPVWTNHLLDQRFPAHPVLVSLHSPRNEQHNQQTEANGDRPTFVEGQRKLMRQDLPAVDHQQNHAHAVTQEEHCKKRCSSHI